MQTLHHFINFPFIFFRVLSIIAISDSIKENRSENPDSNYASKANFLKWKAFVKSSFTAAFTLLINPTPFKLKSDTVERFRVTESRNVG